MSHQLPVECLSKMFETLHSKMLRSCLLVDRFWCKVSVRILWRCIQNYNTLIACLPEEPKEISRKKEIIPSTPTSNPPLFNYSTLVKSLSIGKFDREIRNFL